MSESKAQEVPAEFYTVAVEGSVDPMIAIDQRGNVLYFNPAAVKAFQYEADEVVGKNVKMLMPDPYQSQHDGYLHNYRQTGQKKIIGIGREVEAKRKDGSTFPIHLSISEIAFQGKKVFLGVARDISNLRELQSRLAESEEQSKNFVETAVDGIISIDAKGIIGSVNPAACRLFEYEPDEMVGQNVKMLMPEPYRSGHDGYLKHYHQTGEKKIIGIGREVICVTKSKRTFPAHLSISEYMARGKKIFAGIIRDISSLKEYEEKIKSVSEEQRKQLWIVGRQLQLADALNSNRESQEFFQGLLNRCVESLGADAGCFYEVIDSLNSDENQRLRFRCGNTSPAMEQNREIPFGEGIVGQAAADRQLRVVENKNDFFVESSFGKLKPALLLVLPIERSEKTLGVLELAFTSNADIASIKQVLENSQVSISIAIEGLLAKQRINELLQQAQRQSIELEKNNADLTQKSYELKSQQEELATTNEELQQKTHELQAQQEELEASNEELEEQRNALGQQKEKLELANQTLSQSQLDLKRQQEELKSASRYKSEFLANMSHELRTPLNSLLILSKLLSENEEHNLTEDQVNYATIIHSAGSELLNLINDVLDLSKVEVGKLEIKRENVAITTIVRSMQQLFVHSMAEKGLTFDQIVAPDVPASVFTDRIRIEQILKNLIGNAQKFTENGHVKMRVNKYSDEEIIFSIEDSGIGIDQEKLDEIFEAFKQIDGTLNRKYAGTGLGLSISKSLAELLGGKLLVESQAGSGSTFSLIVPIKEIKRVMSSPVAKKIHGGETKSLEDHRGKIKPGDKVVQIVEDDVDFARSLIEYAKSRNFKCVVSTDGESGLKDAQSFSPDVILLDINLPKLDGLRVLEKLRSNPGTVKTPIYIMSGAGHESKSQALGATDYFLKPVQFEKLDSVFGEALSPKNDQILLVEDDPDASFSIQQLIQKRGYRVKIAANVESARKLVMKEDYECVVLDLFLGQDSGLAFLSWLKSNEKFADLPVVVHTGADIEPAEESQLLEHTKSIVVKSAQSPARLMDEISHFIERKNKVVEERITQLVKGADDVLAEKTVLVVDDDMRNAFSLKEVLKRKKMNIVIAKNGIEAIEKTKATQPLDIVLMDIMMPEMDGLEAMRRIRGEQEFSDLPIIALTAKAMREDRESCIEAGASDYLSKPVDLEKLVNLMSMLLRR